MKTSKKNPNRLQLPSLVFQGLYRAANLLPIIPSSGNYNLTVSHAKKFIWFRVAKVGTRTILNHLKECDVSLDVEHASWVHYPVRWYSRYYKFAFVRNPWDRLVSCWRNKVLESNHFQFDNSTHEKMKIFDQFVEFVAELDVAKCDRHLRLQSALIDLNTVDFVGRMENFDQDMDIVFRRLEIQGRKPVRKNTTSKNTEYQGFYCDRLIEKVALIYQKDVNVFGYQF